ncbi:MAG: hypothetical protein B6226_01570 [Candidatus Cloacimonetes bacterium 4572_65]|nr:MAG: hypothetical protein B6226_01570 [Candidatus Cloacimonetes bacterium 4572_65]
MAKLTDKDKKLISEAIASAEKNTSGEISVVVAKQSSDYAVYELTFALILGILFTVEIIADTGIAAVYSNDSWSKQVARIITGVKDNKFSSELSEVIKTIGKVLTKNFPIKDDDTNELSNEVKEI